MIIGSEKKGFKCKRRPLEKGEVIPLYLPQAALLMSAALEADAIKRKRKYELNWKNKLNRESYKRCKERKIKAG